ncbi:hypothetical protein [Pelagibius sp. Alg239-R121]|uniref:hypothetical protein n=1 Tax=Pelagibius sp. Alg239-R121 TaxID=2993448 RepID=UPI0024A6B7CF|nr:hypothetical protein [Pelagibius sp. Alg239-R121]
MKMWQSSLRADAARIYVGKGTAYLSCFPSQDDGDTGTIEFYMPVSLRLTERPHNFLEHNQQIHIVYADSNDPAGLFVQSKKNAGRDDRLNDFDEILFRRLTVQQARRQNDVVDTRIAGILVVCIYEHSDKNGIIVVYAVKYGVRRFLVA